MSTLALMMAAAGAVTRKFSGRFVAASGQTLSMSSPVTCTGDFTLEAWVNPTAGGVASNPTIGGHHDWSTGNNSQFRIYGGKLFCYANGMSLTGAITVYANTWVHLAIARASGTLRFFVGGVLDVSATGFTNTLYFDCIGALTPGLDRFDGLIHDFRLNNTTALYTSSFTPPTADLTSVSGTQMLTCQSATFVNNSPSGITLTANNGASIVAQSPF